MIRDDYIYRVHQNLPDSAVERLSKKVYLGSVVERLSEVYVGPLIDATSIDSTRLGSILEFKNSEHRNLTVGGAVQEIRTVQDLYLKEVRKKYPNAYYPQSGQEAFVQVKEVELDAGRVITAGNGSFHVNLSLPFSGLDYVEFFRQHLFAMVTLQWLESLMVASLGSPDPFSVGDDHRLTEGSFRLILSSTTGLANARLSTVELPNFEDVIRARAAISERTCSKAHQNLRHSIYSDPKLTASYKTGQKYWTCGTDFRNDGDHDDIYIGEYFGFEFRILDAMPLTYIEQVLRLILLICDHSYVLYQRKVEIFSPTDSHHWNRMTLKILQEGFNARVTPEEQAEILNTFQMDFIKALPNPTTAHNFLDIISEGLFTKYGNSGIYSMHVSKSANGEYYVGPPKLNPCLNMLRFFDSIETFYVNPETKKIRGYLQTFYDLIPTKGTISMEKLAMTVEAIYIEEVEDFVYYLLHRRMIRIVDEDEFGDIRSIRRS